MKIEYTTVPMARRRMPRWVRWMILIFVSMFVAGILWITLFLIHFWSLGPIGN